MADKANTKLYLVTITMAIAAENGEECDDFVDFLLGDQEVESVIIEPHPGFSDGDEDE